MTVETIDQRAIVQYITDTYAGVDVLSPDEGVGAGDTFFIYDPDRNLAGKQQFPFATLVTKDYGDFDCASDLNRAGIFRLNIGVTSEDGATNTTNYLSWPGPKVPPTGGGAGGRVGENGGKILGVHTPG